MPELPRTWLRGIRVGKVDKPEVSDTIADLRSHFVTLSEAG